MSFRLWLEERLIDKRLIDQVGPHKVYLVNASAIRDKSTADDDFNHIGTHPLFPKLVPDGEVWISQDISKHERTFLIHNGLNQYKAKSKGIKDWYDYALRREKAEREKVDGVKFEGKQGKTIPEKLYVKPYCQIGLDYKVWLVNGELVRDTFKTDFIEGANPEVYPWCPKKEIWIEKNLLEKDEIPVTILHEYVEATLMIKKKFKYDHAHEIAVQVDWRHRNRFGKKDVEGLTRDKALKMAAQFTGGSRNQK